MLVVMVKLWVLVPMAVKVEIEVVDVLMVKEQTLDLVSHIL